MGWLSRLADALVPTGPILDPEDCLDQEQPTQRRVERWCVGRVDTLGDVGMCHGWPEDHCSVCGRGFDEWKAWHFDRRKCPNACHWTPCGEVGGCSPIGVARTDRCSGRWRDVFAGYDMARPNYGAWPNPCAREV